MIRAAIVIVLFEPKTDNWKLSVDTILKCGYFPIIIDNSEISPAIGDTTGFMYVRHNENRGIAWAQNKGIKKALEMKVDIIGFFDQDSMISVELLSKLMLALERDNVSLVAPVSYDENSGEEYPSHRISKSGKLQEIFCQSQSNLVPVDIAISSGTFARREVFDKVGFFNEGLFIDFVDIEWCLKCKKNGVQLYIIPEAKMYHSIGEIKKQIGPFVVEVHSPYRTYYKIRNALLLLKDGMGVKFSFFQIVPAVVLNFFLMFDTNKGKEYRIYYMQGLLDGIRGLNGKYESIHKILR